ncbi:hypothetical protein ACP26L_18255 [Paenibacillus sp. S-38]|uniref:hypothetical protein n=1 Tax=Paenibacillus sp. S-38 TaxID=3416710 RepID=UPI003CE73F0A
MDKINRIEPANDKEIEFNEKNNPDISFFMEMINEPDELLIGRYQFTYKDRVHSNSEARRFINFLKCINN